MVFDKMVAMFEDDDLGLEEYLEFDRIENKRHLRPDIHAFLLLDELCPDPGNGLISAAEHDVFYLDVDPEKLAEVITEEQVLELLRCGVHLDENDYLATFA